MPKLWRRWRTRREPLAATLHSGRNDIPKEKVKSPSILSSSTGSTPSRRSTVHSESSDTSDNTLVEQASDASSETQYDESSASHKDKRRRGWRSRFPPVPSLLQISVTIGEATDIPYLKGVAAIVNILTNTALTASDDHDECLRMQERVEEMRKTVKGNLSQEHECSSETKEELQKLLSTLGDVESALESKSKRTQLARLVHSAEIREVMEKCELDLQHCLNRVQLHANVGTRRAIKKRDTADDAFYSEFNRHTEVRKEHSESLASDNPPPKADLKSLLFKRSTAKSSRDLTAKLPPCPEVFCGRNNDLALVLDTMIAKSQAHFVICGGVGVGKSCLAQRFIHHERTIEAYGSLRHFVTCDALADVTGLLAAIAFGLDIPEKAAKSKEDLLSYLRKHSKRRLIVLDNFETLWMPSASRRSVEAFITELSVLPTICILVTMRGTQRPFGPKWSKFLSLRSLDFPSAKAAFALLSDQCPDDLAIDDLVRAVDCLPLSINILGHLAQYQPASFLFDRYLAEGNVMLSEGTDRSTSVDHAFGLSIQSTIMGDCPHALAVLRKLTVADSSRTREEWVKTVPWQLPQAVVQRCITAILQSSLAGIDDEQHLYIPHPVRDYLLRHKDLF